MNSPVSCLLDPIQNMVRKNKNKDKKKGSRRGNGLNTVPRSVRVAAPSAMGGVISKNRSMLPLVAGVGRSMTVQNYEQIGNLPLATGVFTIAGLTANPGVAALPWLSGVALSYSKFRWKFLRFMYVPQCSTATPGIVYIDISYDAADTPPTSTAQVAQADSSSIGPCWHGGGINAEKAFRQDLGVDDMVFVDVDCTKFTQPYYYIRQQANLDADTKDVVAFYGGDQTPAALVATGALYCAYIVELFEPIAPALNK